VQFHRESVDPNRKTWTALPKTTQFGHKNKGLPRPVHMRLIWSTAKAYKAALIVYKGLANAKRLTQRDRATAACCAYVGKVDCAVVLYSQKRKTLFEPPFLDLGERTHSIVGKPVSSQLNFFAIAYDWDVMNGNLSKLPFF